MPSSEICINKNKYTVCEQRHLCLLQSPGGETLFREHRKSYFKSVTSSSSHRIEPSKKFMGRNENKMQLLISVQENTEPPKFIMFPDMWKHSGDMHTHCFWPPVFSMQYSTQTPSKASCNICFSPPLSHLSSLMLQSSTHTVQVTLHLTSKFHVVYIFFYFFFISMQQSLAFYTR